MILQSYFRLVRLRSRVLYRLPVTVHKAFPTRNVSSIPYHRTLTMSTDDDGPGKHIELTSTNQRLPLITEAKITDIRDESSTVKSFTLAINDPQFTFLPGQWVDLFIPRINTVGGFSIYSSPHQLREKGTIDLGVKIANWPPAHWLHNECEIGSVVSIRSGGDFFYHPIECDDPFDILLIGGGVGINPLASIFQYASHLHLKYNNKLSEFKPGSVQLIYSSKTSPELLYTHMFDQISSQVPRMHLKYHITQENESLHPNTTFGRINKVTISEALIGLNRKTLVSYICGPPPMIESMNALLLSLGLLKHQIQYEKWW